MTKTNILLLVITMVLFTMAPMSATFAADGIKVQFFNGNTATLTNTLYPNFKLVNTGTTALTLSTIKMRYYFTNDGTQANSFACDWSTVGNANVTGTFGTVTGTNADRYLEIGFTSGAGSLAVGASIEVKGRMWKSDWSNFTQTNDYSFNAAASNYVDWSQVTAYINEILAWGIEIGVSPTATATATPTYTPSVTATPNPTPSITPTPTPSYTPNPTPSITPTPTPSYTPNPTPSITPTPTPSYTPNPTPSITPTPTPTPTPNTTPTPAPTGTVNIPWNWSGIIGTGQSLAVGAEGNPVLSTTQSYNNLKLSLGSLTTYPFDPNSSQLSMIPLVEPIRVYGIYNPPGPWPGNIFGETPHTAMGSQISAMVKAVSGADYITAHTEVGESGMGIDCLRKGAVDTGSSGRAYVATLFEVQAIKNLATKAGKTYGVGGIIITHGEHDSGLVTYEDELHQLWSDYNQDIKAITGQTQKIVMLVTQQNSCGPNSASTLAQWKVGVDYPGDIICAGPNYYLPYANDGVHLVANGYQMLGEKYGKVYYEKVVLGHDWQPLQPTSVERTSTRVITVNFNVPVAPLVWDTTMPAPNQTAYTEWANGKGFEVYTTSGSRITISSVDIVGNSVKITCASDLPTSYLKVGYAFTSNLTKRTNGTVRWGLLRDSDPFKGSVTGVSQPNYCVAFELAVP